MYSVQLNKGSQQEADLVYAMNDYLLRLLGKVENPVKAEVCNFWVERKPGGDGVVIVGKIKVPGTNRVYSCSATTDHHAYVIFAGQGDKDRFLRETVFSMTQKLLDELLKKEIGYSYTEIYRTVMECRVRRYREQMLNGPMVVADPANPEKMVAVQDPVILDWNAQNSDKECRKFQESERERTEKSYWGKF